MNNDLTSVASVQVEYFPEADSADGQPTVILIRATGDEGSDRAKSRARDLSKSTGDLSYVIGYSDRHVSIGHIVYSAGRISSRAGVFE